MFCVWNGFVKIRNKEQSMESYKKYKAKNQMKLVDRFELVCVSNLFV